MGIEIERKFLVTGTPWSDGESHCEEMSQAYLGGERASVRVRTAGDKAWLNIKSRELGASRKEFEYAIPLPDARELMKLAGNPVAKRRHWIDYQGFTWEVDEFLGDNVGLVVAEIELPAVDAPFSRPPWLGREVTDDPRYYNTWLAEHPYRTWSD
jgi:adenylate cyclase